MNEIEQLVRRILTVAAALALSAAIGLGLFLGPAFALAVLIGASLACGSFFLMQRDLGKLLDQVAAAGKDGAETAVGGLLKLSFWTRSLGRLAVLALALAALATRTAAHPVGLVVGLSVIPAGVIIAGMTGIARKRRFGISD